MKILLFFLIITNLFAQTFVQSNPDKLRALGYEVKKVSQFGSYIYCELPKEAYTKVKSQGFEAYDLEDYKVEVCSDTFPSYLPDFFKTKGWNLQTIGFYNRTILSQLYKGENNSTIFILDTGMPMDSSNNLHPFLQSRGKIHIWNNYVPYDTTNLNSRDNTNIDFHGHAHWTGGILAYNNRETDIYFCKVLSFMGYGYWNWAMSGIQDGINHAKETGKTVFISMSLSGGLPFKPLENLVAYIDSLRDSGIYIYLICSGGNNASTFPQFPAAYSNWGSRIENKNGYKCVISVGATQLVKGTLSLAYYSSHGRMIDIFAPGGGYAIDSTAVLGLASKYYTTYDYGRLKEDTTWRYLSGTSASAPHVASALANLVRILPENKFDIKKYLIDNSPNFTYYDNDSNFYVGKKLHLSSLYFYKYKYTNHEGWYGPLHKNNAPYPLNLYDYTSPEVTENFTLETSTEHSPMINQDFEFSTHSLKFSLLAPQSGSHSQFMYVSPFPLNPRGGFQFDYKLEIDKPVQIGQWVGSINISTIKNGKIYTCMPFSILGEDEGRWTQNNVRFPVEVPNEVDTLLFIFLDRYLGTDVNKEYFLDNLYCRKDTLWGWEKISSLGEATGTTNVEKEFTIIKYKLYQNYPNPFNPTTIIKFDLPKNDFVTLKIFDILGREIKTIIEGQLMKGTYEKQFTANLPSGIYFYTLKTSDFTETKKLQIIK